MCRNIEAEESLINAPPNVRYVHPTDALVMGFILHSYGYLPAALPRPAYIYGHLPFSGVTQTGDVFYRCEHWPTSRRVLRGTDEVLAGTYGFPASELNFVPTGFCGRGPLCVARFVSGVSPLSDNVTKWIHPPMRRLRSALRSGGRRRGSNVSKEIQKCDHDSAADGTTFTLLIEFATCGNNVGERQVPTTLVHCEILRKKPSESSASRACWSHVPCRKWRSLAALLLPSASQREEPRA